MLENGRILKNFGKLQLFVAFSDFAGADHDMPLQRRNFLCIPLDVQKEKYDEIKAAADKAGETVNGYIKKAIEQRMENENGSVE